MILCTLCNGCHNRDDCDGEPESRWWGKRCRNYVGQQWIEEQAYDESMNDTGESEDD